MLIDHFKMNRASKLLYRERITMVTKTVAPPKELRSGFTFIELLLVIVIIGVIISVIVPRAWRANIEAKYGLVQQAATELGSWGMTWAERNQESQGETDSCVLNQYVNTLVGFTGDESATANWTTDGASYLTPPCRASGTITYTVADIMPQEKQPRNPFNGLSYFNAVNNGATLQTGLLRLLKFPPGVPSGGTDYDYYFVYTGTDSTGTGNYHAGMGTGSSLAELRNGIFMARLRQ